MNDQTKQKRKKPMSVIRQGTFLPFLFPLCSNL